MTLRGQGNSMLSVRWKKSVASVPDTPSNCLLPLHIQQVKHFLPLSLTETGKAFHIQRGSSSPPPSIASGKCNERSPLVPAAGAEKAGHPFQDTLPYISLSPDQAFLLRTIAFMISRYAAKSTPAIGQRIQVKSHRMVTKLHTK